MICKATTSGSHRGISRRPWGRPGDPEFQIPGTKETGRLQFFFHCPDSELPIRDILDRQHHGCKTEPHIEKCAENYCSTCDPLNIVGFLKSEEKYLCLFTTCQNPQRKNRRLVVGYIEKQSAFLHRRHGESWWSVQGPTKLVSFDDAYVLDRSVGGPHYGAIRHRKLDEYQTSKVLARLKDGRNILSKCVTEIRSLACHTYAI